MTTIRAKSRQWDVVIFVKRSVLRRDFKWDLTLFAGFHVEIFIIESLKVFLPREGLLVENTS
jgi:hypothetical protein